MVRHGKKEMDLQHWFGLTTRISFTRERGGGGATASQSFRENEAEPQPQIVAASLCTVLLANEDAAL